MTKVINEAQLRRIIREEIELIDLGQGALDLTDEKIDALFKISTLAEYLEDEVECAGSRRNAVYNSLSVDDENGLLTVSDIDGLFFEYTWNDKTHSWRKTK